MKSMHDISFGAGALSQFFEKLVLAVEYGGK